MILVTGARGMLGHDLLELFGDTARGVYHDEMEITDPASVEKALKGSATEGGDQCRRIHRCGRLRDGT